jgi:shikimate kinase
MDHLPDFPPLVFLIGYRGSGKSTVARLLADRLSWQALDMDAEIEARQGKSIRRIFAEEGEPAFRRLESNLLHEVSSLTKHVVATGGGIILDRENRTCLRNSGTVIYLTGQPATLWNRILQDATTAERRPDLTVGGLAEVEQVLSERENLYQQCANFMVPVDDRSPEELADSLAQLLTTMLPTKN